MSELINLANGVRIFARIGQNKNKIKNSKWNTMDLKENVVNFEMEHEMN